MLTVAVVLLCILLSPATGLIFKVPESVPIGHVVGYVEGTPKLSTEPRYFIVYSDAATEKLLKVDDRSGEITTISLLDFEKASKYELLAVPLEGGDGITCNIEVDDENDHQPTFLEEKITIDISELSRIGAEYPLPLASDPDGPSYNVQKYPIAQGNVNNVFKIVSRRLNNILYADLVVNGQLDREYRDKYELIVEAVDGGKPEKIGRLRVHIMILDANDNVPIFEKPRYSISVPPSTSIGSPILTIRATDADVGENSRLSYRLQKTRSSSLSFFGLSSSGVLSSTSHLLPGTVHDLVVVASDNGKPPLETSAFVTVTVLGSSLDDPALDIIWLTDSSAAHLLENITLGSIVARLSLNQKQRDSQVSLSGCPGLCLQQSDSSHIYLLLVCGIFDRETMAEYHLKVTLRKDGETIMEHPLLLTIGDVNDNAPTWPQENVHISLNRGGTEKTTSLVAFDPDQGTNGRIRYSIIGSDVISIDPDTGRMITDKELDCSLGSELKFRVRAADGGTPSLYSELQVTADLVDASGRPPQFEKPLYEVVIKEDTDKGTCLLKVKANNSICGGSSKIRYAFQETSPQKLFSLDSVTGTLCLEATLDFELHTSHQLRVSATDTNGLVGSCQVSVRVLDVNDHLPQFRPAEYNVSVREGEAPVGPMAAVSASDMDEGSFGQIKYTILSDPLGAIRVDAQTGELFAHGMLRRGKYDVTVGAADGNGATAEQPALVHITVLGRDAPSPTFTQSKYVIKTSEDILPGISIGAVQAIGKGNIRYSIYSGDVDHQFTIHPENGRITVARYLDAEKHDSVLLNVQAEVAGGGSNHTQVIVIIDDHNDNPPVFPSDVIEVTIREDQPIHEPFYVVHATDRDKKKNGAITYSLVSSHPACSLMIQPMTGQIQLTAPLDYETTKQYRIRIKATDGGIPPRSANVSIDLRISDVNDNPPLFDRQHYDVTVVENSPEMTEITTLKAIDLDSDENARITYRIDNGSEVFGIDERSGSLFVQRNIDREKQANYDVIVTVEDRGQPPLSSRVTVHVRVLDVNDNAPSCGSAHTVVVPSDADVTTPFGSLVITDPDFGENGTVVYRLQQTHPLFILNNNGDLHLRRLLRDTDPSDYRLAVIASDQGQPKKSAVCQIPVKVAKGTTGVKLVQPVVRTVRIPSNCSAGCRIQKINATGVSKWQIQSSDVSSLFSVSADGWLSLVSLPSSLPPWSLTLILTDKEGKQKHVTIKLLPPVSKNLRESVVLSPSLPIGSKVAVIGEASRDFQWFYKMANKSCLFELDQVSGVVFLAGRLRDHQGQTVHLYFDRVNTTDYETEEIEMEFEIASNPAERPVFKEQSVELKIMEDIPIDSVITTVSARVSESNSSISYRLLFPSDCFTVDQYSGDVILKQQLDWYEVPVHRLVVEAATASSRSSQLLTIEVVDVNNNKPDIIGPDTVFIWSDSSRVVCTLSARDRDRGRAGDVTFDIVTDSDDFAIGEHSGEITVERIPTEDVVLTIRAADNGTPVLYTDKKIIVRVMTTGQRWRHFDQRDISWNIDDDVIVGATIGSIEDKGSAHLQFVNLPAGLRTSRGDVIMDSRLLPGSYKFTVLATSASGDTDWATVSLQMTSPPEAPRISSASCGGVVVPENRAIKAMKRIVAAGKEINFKLQGRQSVFSIEARTGDISCSELDRETKAEHLLVVVAEQNGKNDSCTVRVRVADDNDNAPQFAASTPQMVSINETTHSGDVIERLSAIDLDSGDNGRIVYELIEDPSMLIEIGTTTGEMILARNGRHSQREWMIRVRASDRGNNQLSSDRFIRVRDDRDSVSKEETQTEKVAFVRQQYVASVDEGLDRGQTVARVVSNSRDSRITYSIVEGNVDSAFEIDSEGVIQTSQELDFEIRPAYQLRVIGTGPFNGEISTKVDVKINNLNDNPPAFPKSKNRKIAEDIAVGSYVTTVTANDIDGLDILQYSLDENERRFVIDRFTGVVHLRESLDYETTRDIAVKVMATDGKHSAIGGFTVSLTDVNDNAPHFSKPFYDIQVPTTAQSYDVILKLVATDKDSGENGRVSYSLEGHEDTFSISSEGQLSLLVPLRVGLEYIVTVLAVDYGQPRLTSTVAVRITVSDQLPKQQPHFKQHSYEFLLSESSPAHSFVGNVSVGSDPQWYRIDDQLVGGVFTIDRLGRITTMTSLDRETKEVYTFEVDVGSESVAYSQNASCLVTIRVTDSNDNSPVFRREEALVVMKDGMTNGEVLLRLSASDADSGENGRVSYRILSGNDYGIVSLAPDTGALMFHEWNDEVLTRNSNGSWVTVVEARDHGHPSRSTILPVQFSVSLSSWSATAPFFVQSQYVTHVRETATRDTVVFVARAVNRAGIQIAGLTYALKQPDETFSMDPESGGVRLISRLDFETRPSYELTLTSSDRRGRSAVVTLMIRVTPVDEYPPVFTKQRYNVQVPLDTAQGAVVGVVRAIDADGGLHGVVRYTIEGHYSLVTVDEKTGELRLRHGIQDRQNLTIEQFSVIAYSGASQNTRATVYLEIGSFPGGSSPFTTTTFKIAALATVVLFCVLLILLVVCVCCKRSTIKQVDNPKKQVFSVSKGNVAVLSDARRMSPAYAVAGLPNNTQQIKSNSMTSSISTSSCLRSSSREFVSTRSQPDSGIDPDTVSVNSSVTDYLVSIGVNPHPIAPKPRGRRRDTVDSHLNELIYARVDDVIGPGAMDVSTSNYPPIHHNIAPLPSCSRVPSYQPLTEIFSEITRLQKEEKDRQRPPREYVQIEI